MYFSDWLTSASTLGASPLFISRVRVFYFQLQSTWVLGCDWGAILPFSLSEANSRSAVQLKRISEIKLKIFTHFFRVLYTLAQDVHSLARIAHFQSTFFRKTFSRLRLASAGRRRRAHSDFCLFAHDTTLLRHCELFSLPSILSTLGQYFARYDVFALRSSSMKSFLYF